MRPHLGRRKSAPKPSPTLSSTPRTSPRRSTTLSRITLSSPLSRLHYSQPYANSSQNHNPLAQNGSDSAWSILSPIWASQNITPLRTTFQGTQSWLNYNNSVFGEVVDRFRWEGGCIVEHVSFKVQRSNRVQDGR